jgi:hypothetical protein
MRDGLGVQAGDRCVRPVECELVDALRPLRAEAEVRSAFIDDEHPVRLPGSIILKPLSPSTSAMERAIPVAVPVTGAVLL